MEKKIHHPIYKVVGANISKIRTDGRKTQSQFADELNDFLKKKFKVTANYDSKTISNWENAVSMPKLEVLIAISKLYNLSLDELLHEEIKDMVINSPFSDSEEYLLGELVKNPNVCKEENGKLVSAFDSKRYRYGYLSYLADNLVDYRGEFGKVFKNPKPTKYAIVTVGILDVNNGKKELHFLGSGENDIVSIDRVVCSCLDNKEVSNPMDIHRHTIKLGNGNCYHIEEWPLDECPKRLISFEDEKVPEDLGRMELNAEEYDWTDYACLKGQDVIDNKLFDIIFMGTKYYKKAGIIEIELSGEIMCSDAQLIKVLADDYKQQLITKLSEISDESTYEVLEKELLNYKTGGD